jgi:hypothetical protein
MNTGRILEARCMSDLSVRSEVIRHTHADTFTGARTHTHVKTWFSLPPWSKQEQINFFLLVEPNFLPCKSKGEKVSSPWSYMQQSRYSSAPDRGVFFALRTGRFNLVEIDPGTHWIGSWVGPRAGLDTVEKRTILTSAENQTPAVEPVARNPSLYRLSYLQSRS